MVPAPPAKTVTQSPQLIQCAAGSTIQTPGSNARTGFGWWRRICPIRFFLRRTHFCWQRCKYQLPAPLSLRLRDCRGGHRQQGASGSRITAGTVRNSRAVVMALNSGMSRREMKSPRSPSFPSTKFCAHQPIEFRYTGSPHIRDFLTFSRSNGAWST